jgi:hypothetical protein
MSSGAMIALAALVVLGGCAGRSQATCGCPALVHYGAAQHRQIQAALDALPPTNILHQTMTDYENERDDLRFCGR